MPKDFDGASTQWQDFRIQIECYFNSMSPKYEVVLNHSPKRYDLENPTDQGQVVMARIEDTQWLFHHTNNYFTIIARSMTRSRHSAAKDRQQSTSTSRTLRKPRWSK
jgi:hypothetical protein